MNFSLQKRFSLFLLLPVALILIVAGLGSFFYASYYLVGQWSSTSVLKLEKTAHQIQMRLNEKLQLIELIAKADEVPNGGVTKAYLIQQLRSQNGVRFVDIESSGSTRNNPGRIKNSRDAAAPSRPSGLVCLVYNGEKRQYLSDAPGSEGAKINPHVHTPATVRSCCIKTTSLDTHGTLKIMKRFGGGAGSSAKMLVVTVDFQSLMSNLLEAGQWQGSSAYLVSSDGTYLAGTSDSGRIAGRKLGESSSPLEKRILDEIKSKDFGTLVGDTCNPDIVAGFFRVPNTDWYLLLFSWGHVVLAPILRFQLHFLVAGALALVCSLLLIRQGTKSVVRRIGMVSDAAELVESGDYSVHLADARSDEIGRLNSRFNSMVQGLKQRDFIHQTFGRYVDKNFVKELMSKPEQMNLGGQNRVVTILMADIRGFTEMAEKLAPQQVIRMLNRHFSRVIPVIEKYDGIIVDFVGNSVLAFFDGLDRDVSERAFDAVKCASEILAAVEDTSEGGQKQRDLPDLTVGIGIHAGEVVVGNIGSETRAKYGIVGSAVNETHRIQTHAEGGTVLISKETYEALGERVAVTRRLTADFKGLKGSRVLFEIRASQSTKDPNQDLRREKSHPPSDPLREERGPGKLACSRN